MQRFKYFVLDYLNVKLSSHSHSQIFAIRLVLLPSTLYYQRFKLVYSAARFPFIAIYVWFTPHHIFYQIIICSWINFALWFCGYELVCNFHKSIYPMRLSDNDDQIRKAITGNFSLNFTKPLTVPTYLEDLIKIFRRKCKVM